MKNFGFGCMRLPQTGDAIDMEQTTEMVDRFLAAGFVYFDTARGYMDGLSEAVVRECLTSRYPREAFVLADKLTANYFDSEAEILPLFTDQLAVCGVEYFDYYLMHALDEKRYEKFVACGAFTIAAELKTAGKIRHLGISFHDKPVVLERILAEQPGIEVVQLQFNYYDYDNPSVESGACYDICRKYDKPVIVMEPVRGGYLADLPEEAARILDALHGGSSASYAIRYAASFDGVMMVLSGMSTLAQMEDNLSFMQTFCPLSEQERAAVASVRSILKAQPAIACTACRYCVADCPAQINIPDLFACMNTHRRYQDFSSTWYYMVHTQSGGKASDCMACGRCEQVCPQHLPIRALLEDVAAEFEQNG